MFWRAAAPDCVAGGAVVERRRVIDRRAAVEGSRWGSSALRPRWSIPNRVGRDENLFVRLIRAESHDESSFKGSRYPPGSPASALNFSRRLSAEAAKPRRRTSAARGELRLAGQRKAPPPHMKADPLTVLRSSRAVFDLLLHAVFPSDTAIPGRHRLHDPMEYARAFPTCTAFDMPGTTTVYILQSVAATGRYYTGRTSNLADRLAAHNGGFSSHIADGRPWRVVVSIEFVDEQRAIGSETVT